MVGSSGKRRRQGLILLWIGYGWSWFLGGIEIVGGLNS
jgi:hypothetical protein